MSIAVDQSKPIVSADPKTLASSTLSTTWIPRAVRCSHCEALAYEQVRECLGNEIAVRYACPVCRWERVRHYRETALKSEEEDGRYAD